MKFALRLLSLILLISMVACSGEDDAMDDGGLTDPVTGVIAGVEWQLDVSTAIFEEIDEQYTINLIGVDEQLADDGCSVLFPGQEYVRFTVTAATGRYALPFEFANQGVKFYADRSVGGFELATSGFVEITEITGNQVFGNLEATMDGDNQVSGSFVATICGQ